MCTWVCTVKNQHSSAVHVGKRSKSGCEESGKPESTRQAKHYWKQLTVSFKFSNKTFITLKSNVKFTEKLSRVLLLNLGILQHQLFTLFAREIKLAAPFLHYSLHRKTFKNEELRQNIPNLWPKNGARDTVP